MSSATENPMDAILSSLDSWKPNESKGGKAKAATGRGGKGKAMTGQGKATKGRGGIITPESSLGPDPARNEADEKRRQEEARQAGGDDRDEFATTKAQPPEADEDEAENGDSAGEQADVIKEVLKCGKDEHRKILGVKESYDDAYKEEKEILDAVWERGMRAHPKYNKHKDAETAFRMILDAAAALGTGEDQIEEVENSGGPEEDDDDEDGMDGVERENPAPHKLITQIYREATPHLAQLQKNPKSKVAAKELDKLNDRIKKKNQEDGLEDVDQWAIDYQELSAIYQKAQPTIARLLKNPEDQEAKTQLEEHSRALEGIIRRKHYLNWNIDLELTKPARAQRPSQAQAAKNAKSPGKPPGPAEPKSPGPAETRPKPPGPETQQKPAESEGSTQTAPALSPAVQKIQSETLSYWAKMGWDTHKTSDGEIILSHKPLSREGKEPYAFEFTVMTQDSPYFQIKLGSEVGRQEMDKYLAMPSTYRIHTDPGDEDTPVYTWRDKANYASLLWTATKPRKQTRAGVNPRTGETQCCVLWKNGTVSEMARAHFKKFTTDNEKKAIEKYCKSVDIKPPWEMDPKVLTVPAESTMGQQLLHAGRTGSMLNLAAGPLGTGSLGAETHNAADQGVVTSLQSSMAALQRNQTMMQEQLKKQQDLQSQMQQQQMDLQSKLLQLLDRLGAPSSQAVASN